MGKRRRQGGGAGKKGGADVRTTKAPVAAPQGGAASAGGGLNTVANAGAFESGEISPLCSCKPTVYLCIMPLCTQREDNTMERWLFWTEWQRELDRTDLWRSLKKKPTLLLVLNLLSSSFPPLSISRAPCRCLGRSTDQNRP